MKYLYILEDPLEQFNSKYSGFIYLSDKRDLQFDISKPFVTLHYKGEYEINNNPYYNAFKIIDKVEFKKRYDTFELDSVKELSKILFLIFYNLRDKCSYSDFHKLLYMVVVNLVLTNTSSINIEQKINFTNGNIIFANEKKYFDNLVLPNHKLHSTKVIDSEVYYINMLTRIYFSNNVARKVIYDIWNKCKSCSIDHLFDQNIKHKKFINYLEWNSVEVIELNQILQYEGKF